MFLMNLHKYLCNNKSLFSLIIKPTLYNYVLGASVYILILICAGDLQGLLTCNSNFKGLAIAHCPTNIFVLMTIPLREDICIYYIS